MNTLFRTTHNIFRCLLPSVERRKLPRIINNLQAPSHTMPRPRISHLRRRNEANSICDCKLTLASNVSLIPKAASSCSQADHHLHFLRPITLETFLCRGWLRLPAWARARCAPGTDANCQLIYSYECLNKIQFFRSIIHSNDFLLVHTGRERRGGERPRQAHVLFTQIFPSLRLSLRDST